MENSSLDKAISLSFASKCLRSETFFTETEQLNLNSGNPVKS